MVNLLDDIKNLKKSLNHISVYDLNTYTAIELYYALATKTNEVITELSRFEGVISDEIIEQNEKLTYLLGEGLNIEVINQLNKMYENGDFEELINHSVFEGLNNKITSALNDINKIGVVPSNELQETLNTLTNNNIFILNNKFTVESLNMRNKENIKIIGGGEITQSTTYINNPSYEQPISEKPLLRLADCKNIEFIGLSFCSMYECIDIVGCENITFIDCTFNGNDNNSRFNGVVARDSRNITFTKCNVLKCGKLPTYNTSNNTNNYSLGNGISFYNVHGGTVNDSIIEGCGQNGLYSFASYDISFKHNRVKNNGMSGIQIAYGHGDEKNYIVDSNIIENNYSDGIDINNTMGNMIDTNCIISNNILKSNGWFATDYEKPTQDGSGVATLVNVKNVYGINNIVNDCCRVGLYISNCEEVNMSYKINKSNKGIGTLLYVGGSKNITVSLNGEHYCNDDNAIAIDSSFKENENITILNSYVYSERMLPLYIKGSKAQNNIKVYNSTLKSKETTISIDNIIKYDNVKFISVGKIGANMNDNVILRNCEITSLSSEGFYAPNGCTLINCKVSGSKGCIVWGKSNIRFINTVFEGTDNGVRVDGTTNTSFINCTIKGNSHGLHIVGNSNVKVLNSRITSTNGGNSIRCETGVTVYTDNNIYDGHPEFSGVTHRQLQWQ